MERIVYRKTLDVHKNGIQFTLQGFETADNMARCVEISIMASGDTIDLPLEQLMAIMYVTTPNASEPSINECSIKDNTIVCDVLPIVEEGITEVQLKLIETSFEGAKRVLATPKFAIEVTKSNTDDESVTQTTTYTALENALAKAKGVYDARMLRVEIDKDCTFRIIYADGTIYETDALKETLLQGEALLSQSYARGGTGIRENEDTDNSLYYSNVSKSASAEAQRVSNESTALLQEMTKHGVYTAFSLDFTTGELKYISPLYSFNIDQESGELNAEGEAYTADETINKTVSDWLEQKSALIAESLEQNNIELDELKGYVETVAQSTNDAIELLDSNIRNLGEETTKLNEDIQQLSTQVGENKTEVESAFESVYSNISELDAARESASKDIADLKYKYITEEGKVGDWNYTKWNDGAVEAWATKSVGKLEPPQSGVVYEVGGSFLDFPFMLSENYPIWAFANSYDGFYIGIIPVIDEDDALTANVRLVYTARAFNETTGANAKTNIYVKGKTI